MIALHLIDPTSSDDALQMLATLIARSGGITHHVANLGHAGAAERAVRAGVPADRITKVSSIGWLDFGSWRSVRKLIRKVNPTHIHAWGIRGVVASAVQSSFAGARIATMTCSPLEADMKLLRAAQARASFAWVASSSSVQRALATRGLNNPVRIRPGVSMAQNENAPTREQIRKQLEIPNDHGPVILVGGDPTRAARQDHALHAVGIIIQLFPKTRAIIRLRDDSRSDFLRYFADNLARGHNNCDITIAVEEDEFSWHDLAVASDIFVITPNAPIDVGSIMAAMSANLPIIGTATSEVSELIENKRSGLLAAPNKPKQVAARLDEFMNDSRLRWQFTDAARTDLFAHFKPRYMVECFAAVYAQTHADPSLKNPIELPAPEMTAADRFAGVVATN